MKGWPTGFWGKFSKGETGGEPAGQAGSCSSDPKEDEIARTPDEPRWHPLVDHCADVAACVERLLEQPILRGRIARIGGRHDFGRGQIERLCVLAAMHDIGKFNRGFQEQILPSPRLRAGHVREARVLLDGKVDGFADAVGFRDLAQWTTSDEGVVELLLASIAHHGRPVPEAEGVDLEVWKSHGAERDPMRGIAELARRCREWFPLAYRNDTEPLPDVPQFQHAFSGLVMLADWLGSDTGFFEFSAEDVLERLPLAREAARTACAAVGLDLSASRDRQGDTVKPFQAVFESREPNAVQRTLETLALSEDGGSLVILEAETGSGKTEAAFRHFQRLFAAGKVDGIYFALPTRSAARQIHERISRAVVRSFGEEAPPVILAVPGYLRAGDAQGKPLPGFEVLWLDEPAERERHRRWAAENPKRYMAAPFLVGTIDQVLLSTLQVAHSHLRASALLRHLLVVDEVHASDPYMDTLLSCVLNFHVGKAGGHALLMSATLGSRLRSCTLAGRSVAGPPFDEAVRAPYPAIWSRSDTGSVARCSVSGHTIPPRQILVERLHLAGKADRVAELAIEQARKGARVLVLRNLVADALATQRALEAATDGEHVALFRVGRTVTLHHSRFAPEDRTELDRAIEQRLGKDSPLEPAVVVSTQTVEQSLDIDVDFMITDLCPMDVLLQRIGRLHRHASRRRPAGFETIRLVVLLPDGAANGELSSFIHPSGRGRGPHGLGTVYSDLRVLQATLGALEERSVLEIPRDNRWLVESATHPERLEVASTGDAGRWTSHRNFILGASAAKSGAGALSVVKRREPFSSPEVLFPDRESAARICSRLGEADRLAEFSPPPTGPFGRKVPRLSLPGYWFEGVAGEAVAEALVTNKGGFTFTLGGRGLRYDRLGLRLDTGEEREE